MQEAQAIGRWKHQRQLEHRFRQLTSHSAIKFHSQAGIGLRIFDVRISVHLSWSAQKHAPRPECPFAPAVLQPEPAVLDNIDPEVLCSIVRRISGGELNVRWVIESNQRHTRRFPNHLNAEWLYVQRCATVIVSLRCDGHTSPLNDRHFRLKSRIEGRGLENSQLALNMPSDLSGTLSRQFFAPRCSTLFFWGPKIARRILPKGLRQVSRRRCSHCVRREQLRFGRLFPSASCDLCRGPAFGRYSGHSLDNTPRSALLPHRHRKAVERLDVLTFNERDVCNFVHNRSQLFVRTDLNCDISWLPKPYGFK